MVDYKVLAAFAVIFFLLIIAFGEQKEDCVNDFRTNNPEHIAVICETEE